MDTQTLNWLTETIENTQSKEQLINIATTLEWMAGIDLTDETYQNLIQSVNQKLNQCNP